MTISNKEISLYVDTLMIESLLSTAPITKNAQAGGMISSLIDKVKNYFGAQIDPDNKTGSLLNLIAPAIVAKTFSAFGLGWLGILLGLAMRIFHIDVNSILSSIYDKIKSLVSEGKPTTSAQVDSIVQSAVQENIKPSSESTLEQVWSVLNKTSYQDSMRDARIVKLAMIEYQYMEKTGASFPKEFASLFSAKQAKTAGVLSKILSWFFKIALASAGFMVASDVINKFLGRPNAIDGTIQKGKPVAFEKSPEPAAPVHTSTQTKFKLKSTYSPENYNQNDNWIEKVNNSESSIGDLLISFAKDVYDGLNGKESLIKGTAGFNALVDRISWFNHNAPNNSLLWIPKEFHSKKQIVDYFIDDVAQATN